MVIQSIKLNNQFYFTKLAAFVLQDYFKKERTQTKTQLESSTGIINMTELQQLKTTDWSEEAKKEL